MTKEETDKKNEETKNAEETPQQEVSEAKVPAQGTEAVPEVASEVIKTKEESELDRWVPKTSLGKAVMEGKITSMEEILGTVLSRASHAE